LWKFDAVFPFSSGKISPKKTNPAFELGGQWDVRALEEKRRI